MRTYRHAAFAAGIIPALLASTSVLAQEAAVDADAPAADTVEEAPLAETPVAETNDDAIIVTARRREESAQDVPVSVSVLNAAALEARGVQTEADLQIAIPGLVVRSANNSNQLNYVMRGESVDAYSGSPPGVQPYFNEVPFPLLAATTFYDLENIQAVKGPQGTLFGRNTTGGAVLFQTRRPDDYFNGYVRVDYGNFDRFTGEAAINIPIKQDVAAIRFAGAATSGGAFVRNLYDGKKLGDSDELSGRITLELTPTSRLTNTTMVQISGSDGTPVPNTAYYAIPCGDPSGFNSCTYSPTNQPFFNNLLNGSEVNGYPSGKVYKGGFGNLPDYLRSKGDYVISANARFKAKSENQMVINKTEFELTDDIFLNNIFGYSHNETQFAYDTDYSPYPIIQQYAPEWEQAGAELPIEVSKTEIYSNELQLTGTALDDRLDFIVGGFYYHSTEDYISPLWVAAANALVAYNALTTNESYAVFAQGTYALTDRLSLTLGGRYTWEDIRIEQLDQSVFGVGNPQKVKQEDPSWTVSVDYKLTPDLMAYAATRGSWRRGGFNPFNPPTARPTTAAQAGGGNYFLPEKVRDIEVGLKYSGYVADMPVRANLAYFYSWVSDIQKTAYVVIGGTASSATINVPETEIDGVEADVWARPVDWLSLGGSVVYTNARFTEPDSRLFGNIVTYGPFGDTPEWSGTLYADAEFGLPDDMGSILVHGDLFAQSSFYFSNLGGTIQPGTKLPGYAVLNARVDWDDMFGSNVKVGVFVKNITDKLYYTGGSAGAQNFSVESAAFGRPRTYGISLRTDF